MLKGRKLTLASLFFTFFVDNLSWSIVFPIFAPYFLDPENMLFSADVTTAQRTTLLGLFLMAFSLGQFFGSPLLGEYADKRGRKKALVLSILFTVAGLALSAFSMQIGALWLLFLSRLVTGVFASNVPICLASVADLSVDEKNKTKLFGYLSFFAGLSFIVGAYAGGKLSDSTLNPFFSPFLPLWLAAGLTLFNLLFVITFFRETAEIDPAIQYNFWEGFQNIGQALKTQKIKRIYMIYFLFIMAWTLLFQFTPVLVVERFQFTSSAIGDLAIFMGVFWAISSGYLNKFLHKRVPDLLVLEVCLLVFMILCALIAWTGQLEIMLIFLALAVLAAALAWPICTSVISSLAPRQVQGKILGISQSVQSLAMAVAPVLGGLSYHSSASPPFLIASGASLLAGIIYLLAVKEWGQS